MSQSRASRWAAALLVLLATLPATGQGQGLRIVSAAPTGEVGQLADAEEIRIVFSEPMVPIGTVPSGDAPPWVRMTPSLPGSFYWSGTKTLVFSPDASARLPYATRFSVRVDASATSIAGRSLGAPYELTFTTPTVRLLGADWYRKTARYDSPAVIVLRFNQPVRPADVVAHARVTLAPHAWLPPELQPRTRERLKTTDPAGLERFDRKVAAAERVAASSDPVQVRVADSWDERRFPPQPARVVIETTTAPPTGAWLTVTLDRTMPGAEGDATHAEQSTELRLEDTLFASAQCLRCNPLGSSALVFTRPITLSALARAVRVSDIGQGDVERPVTPVSSITEPLAAFPSQNQNLEQAGFPSPPPARTRRVQIDASLEAADGQTLGYPWSADIEYTHAPYAATLLGGVWEASAGPRIPVRVRNLLSIRQWAERRSPAAVLRLLQQPSLRPSPGGPGSDTSQWFKLTFAPDLVGDHEFDLGPWLSSRGTGLVHVALEPVDILPDSGSPANRSVRSAILQVTNLGVTVKDSPLSTLIFVTRLDTGEPVQASRVAVVVGKDERWQGTTDADGLAVAPAVRLRERRSPSFIVTAEKDGDVAFVASNWGVYPGNWGIDYRPGEAPSILRGSIFTDRGIYRAGEEVHLKAVVRDETAAGVRLLRKGVPLTITVTDARELKVDSRTVAVNKWSSVEWTWRVPQEGSLGTYTVEIGHQAPDSPGSNRESSGDEPVSASFLVAAFRKPDFRVDATLSGAPPVLGAPLRGTIEAKYLFGAALGARPVRWFVRRYRVHEPTQAIRERFQDMRYAVGYMPRQDERRPRRPEEPLPQKTESLRTDGRLEVNLPTVTDDDAAAYRYTFEGDVEAVSGQHIAGRASLVMHPAALYVAVSRPPMFVSTTSGASVGISTVDLNGNRVGSVPVTVSLLREEWVASPRPEAPGSITWERREVPAENGPSARRRPPLLIPVREGGCYVLRAVARDEAGRQARTELTFYATGSGLASWHSEGNRITLTPERTTWKPGETARILIQSPWPDATALLTVEREGIQSHRRFRVHSTQDVVDVPITSAHAPNVFVSVLLVRGRTTEPSPDGTDTGKPSYRVGYAELTVDDPSRRLGVKVSTDREEYRPGERATVSVSVAAADSRRARREVTLWAVDYGLLSLTGYATPDVLKQIYVHKPLRVMTQDNRERLISRRALVASDPQTFQAIIDGLRIFTGASIEELMSLGLPGLSLGESETGGASINVVPRRIDDNVDIRQDFRPLVFWLGSATTDADGRATTTVTLPDSLTTYRIMAVAGDKASQFGFGEREVRVTKPLALMPTFPRFLNTGDRASLAAVVTNSTGSLGEATVTIESLDPVALQLTNATTRTVSLAPGASATVTFDGAARRSGRPRVRMTATLNGQHDAFEVQLPVLSQLRPETTAAYGETAGRATERIALPAGIAPDAGGLSVELASTALVGLGEGARYVTEYPYEFGEVVASRALTLLLASDLGSAFRLSGIKPGDYRAHGVAAVNSLIPYQCGDGGFVNWPGACTLGSSSVYFTAYALHVMKVAERLGVPVNPDVVTLALGFLEQQLREPPPEVHWWPVWGASQAFAVKVLAEHGRNPSADITGLVSGAERLPIFSLSHLADTLAATGDRGPRYQDVVRRLMNALRIDADRAHVEEIDEAALCWLWSTNARATAVVLEGIARRGDEATFVAPLVRWLLAARTDGRWSTTHENAMALEALVAYYRAFESEVPRMKSTVRLGAATIGGAPFKGRSTASHQIQLSMAELLKQVAAVSKPDLTIDREGTGRLYYTARLQTFAPEPPEAIDRGFQLTRRFERYVAEGSSPPTTTFDAGDVVRVTVSVRLRGEGRFVVLTDPLAAGFEPLDNRLATTVSDLARQATRMRTTTSFDLYAQWRRGDFDHVERHDDRVVAFATRLGSGRHEFSYLVRATTAGTFAAAGARMEAMYAPELTGRSAAATVVIK